MHATCKAIPKRRLTNTPTLTKGQLNRHKPVFIHIRFRRWYVLDPIRFDPSLVRIVSTSLSSSTTTRWMTSSCSSTRQSVVRSPRLDLEKIPQVDYACMLPRDRSTSNWYCSDIADTLDTIIPRSVRFLVFSRCCSSRHALPDSFLLWPNVLLSLVYSRKSCPVFRDGKPSSIALLNTWHYMDLVL